MRFALGVALVALVPLTSYAHGWRHHHAPHASWFLGANPHVPLAVVRGTSIGSAVSSQERGHTCGARARWRVTGSRWHALDAWGQITNTFAATSFDDYDVTACAEVSFDAAPRTDTANIYVAEASVWRPSASVKWSPSAALRASFDQVLADVSRGHLQRGAARECTELAEEMRFFDVPSSSGPVHYAIGGRVGGYVIASLHGSTWSRELVKRDALCYRPVAIFDMNADGVPEIILRSATPDSWGDEVLEKTPHGWASVAESPGSSTA